MDKELDEYAEKIAKTIKEIRLEKGLSHDDIAERSGLTRPAISHIESCKRNPSMKNVYSIVRALGMSMNQFIRRVERQRK